MVYGGSPPPVGGKIADRRDCGEQVLAALVVNDTSHYLNTVGWLLARNSKSHLVEHSKPWIGLIGILNILWEEIDEEDEYNKDGGEYD